MSIFLSLPKEIWQTHILYFLNRKDLSTIRLSSKILFELVTFPIWKQWIPSLYDVLLEYYSSNIFCYGVYFHYLDDSGFQLLPPSTRVIDLSECKTRIQDEHLKFLSSSLSLEKIIFPWHGVNLITEVGIEKLLTLFPKTEISFLYFQKTYTILYWACQVRNFDLVQLILTLQRNEKEKKELINQLNGIYSESALFLASYYGLKQIVDLLLENGADINKPRGRDNYSPLFYVCKEGQKEIAEFLLERGADPNYGPSGKTPLMVVIEKGYVSIVRLLLKFGAKVNISDRDGLTVFNYARNSNNPEIIRIIESEWIKLYSYVETN